MRRWTTCVLLALLAASRQEFVTYGHMWVVMLVFDKRGGTPLAFIWHVVATAARRKLRKGNFATAARPPVTRQLKESADERCGIGAKDAPRAIYGTLL